MGRWYEGPKTPPRLVQEVRVFRQLTPNATPEQWAALAERLADISYRAGFTRGLEWNERLWPGPAEDPEVIAEREAYLHSLPDSYFRQPEQRQPSPIVGLSALEAAKLQHQLAHVGARIVIEPPNNKPLTRNRV